MGSCGSKAPKSKKRGRTPAPKPCAKEMTEQSSKEGQQEPVEPDSSSSSSSSLSHYDIISKPSSHERHQNLPKMGTDSSPDTLMPQTNNNYGVSGEKFRICRDLNVKIIQQKVKEESSQDFACQFTKLQCMLKCRYNSFVMKGLPWMENIRLILEKYYVTLKMTSRSNTGRELEPQGTTIKEMFTSLEGQEEPFRILVEGGPGFGKTTLAAKLAYDWAKGEAYLRHFDLVLFAPLRNYAKGWKDTLMNAARLPDDMDFALFLKILFHGNKRLLIILDGYDELSQDYVEEVNSIIQCEVLFDATVVVTSRPGKFTANSVEEGREWFRNPQEISVDISNFFNKKIMILGFDTSMQKEFIETHTAGFSKPVKDSILQNIDHIQRNEFLTTEFLRCPLFLLMIILLLTEPRNIHMQNLKTRTDLYKKVFNFVLQRYFSKSGDPSAPRIDLFSLTKDRTSIYTRLIIQFSHFAFNAICKNIYVFSKEVLDNSLNICSNENSDSNRLILLDLGFLTESLFDEGFHQNRIYEPVHKSLLEFAAAYFVWISFLNGQHDIWLHQVHTLRPRTDVGLESSSLAFPFLAGLMGKKAWMLFDALHPYAAEYSLWFESLKFSLLESQITPKLMASLSPLLPLELEISCAQGDGSFATSRHHEEIIRCGIMQDKIKIIQWDPFLEAAFPPGKVVVEKVILQFEDPSFPWGYKVPANGLQCKHLWCCFMPAGPRSSNKDWTTALSFMQQIEFESISFMIFCGSVAFPYVFEVMATDLSEYDVNCIRYVVEDNYSHIERLAALIRGDQLEALELILHHPKDEKTDGDLVIPLSEKAQKCCKSVSQKQMDHLVECSSKSTKLVHFVMENDPRNPLIVDMSLLCNRGKKNWKYLCLKGVTIICSLKVDQLFEINHLEIIESQINTAADLTNNVLCYCHVSSFACCDQTLLNMDNSPFPDNSLTELLLQINAGINHHRFPLDIRNLKILVLEMSSFVSDSEFLTSIETLSACISNVLDLRGIELLNIDQNHRFVESFVDYLFGACKTKSTVEHSEVNKLQKRLHHLEYIMLHTELTHETRHLVSGKKTIPQCLSAIAKIKLPLEKHLLPRFELVCDPDVLNYMWNFEGVGALSTIFPTSAGFTFAVDFYGNRNDDSIRAKELYERRPQPHKRCSIMFNP